MKYAKADLILANIPLPAGGLYEQLCFLTQQAAEKAIKAVLRYLSIPFPYTHNIQGLLEILPKQYLTIPELFGAISLTSYATSSRYPRLYDPVNEEEYKNAVAIAEAVVAWADSIIHNEG